MSRKSGRKIALVLMALLATSPAAAYADQFTDANLYRAQVNTRLANQKARAQAEQPRGNTAAAKTATHTDVRRTRTVHAALSRQANQLSIQNGH